MPMNRIQFQSGCRLRKSKNGVSALALVRYVGVSYPTAWLQRHKLMQVCFDLSTPKSPTPPLRSKHARSQQRARIAKSQAAC